jgi:NADH:ubiquinone oxidoreductase subunit 3 (subunit A)
MVDLFIVIFLLLIWLFLLGLSISMLYRRKTVKLEKVKVYGAYLSGALISMLATLLSVQIVNDNIDLIYSWIGNHFDSYGLVNILFCCLLIVPMLILFFIIRWKKRELEKNSDSE